MFAGVTFDAIVLAGGDGERLGGIDKATIELGGSTFLERSLRAVQSADAVIVVGPPRPLAFDVLWTVEEPAGSGPAAAVGAGIRLVSAEIVVVLAVDLPLVTHAHVDKLVAAVAGHDGACFVDDEGRDQLLAAAYETEALKQATSRDLGGASIRSMIDGLDLARLRDPVAGVDCDTPEDLATIEEMEEQDVR